MATTAQFRRAQGAAGPIRRSARRPGRSSQSFEERRGAAVNQARVGGGVDVDDGHALNCHGQDRHRVQVGIGMNNVLDGLVRVVLMKSTRIAVVVVVVVCTAEPVGCGVAFTGIVVGKSSRCPTDGLPRKHEPDEDKG